MGSIWPRVNTWLPFLNCQYLNYSPLDIWTIAYPIAERCVSRINNLTVKIGLGWGHLWIWSLLHLMLSLVIWNNSFLRILLTVSTVCLILKFRCSPDLPNTSRLCLCTCIWFDNCKNCSFIYFHHFYGIQFCACVCSVVVISACVF